ncbi:hypothetical protein QUF75_05870 [Desulfococcaceae bacterium HSG7]|nr:hypothetical protein [Desulfococcaceae bacterium HSG7]
MLKSAALKIKILIVFDLLTVVRGIKEVKNPLSDKEKNIRKAGGERKSVLSATDGPDDAFSEVLRNHTAGSPMDDTIKQTNSSRGEIAGQLTKQGFSISVTAVDRLLEKYDFHPRQAFKTEVGKHNIPNRDEQFKNIECLKKEYHSQGDPVMITITYFSNVS